METKFIVNSTGSNWTVDGIRGEFRIKSRMGGWADILHCYSDGDEYKIERVGNVCTHTWGLDGCVNADFRIQVEQEIKYYIARITANRNATPVI
jgi:hypothetical protein